MESLMLVDLQVQRDAVAELIKGWEVRQVIDWMCQYGTVTETVSRYGKIFIAAGPPRPPNQKAGSDLTIAARFLKFRFIQAASQKQSPSICHRA